MLLQEKEKIHVVQRRAFENDLRRHFVGEVTEAGEMAVRAKGYVFVLDKILNRYVRLPELRTRIVSLADAALIINILPQEANIDRVAYTTNDAAHLVVTDGETFMLNVNEFGPSR